MNWIARENKTPANVNTINSFNKYWADMIALVNQTAVPASQHGYSIAAMDNNALLALYSKLCANLDIVYAGTQESIKTRATSLVTMQGQLANIQQFCMAVGQQPPPSIYAPTHQQHTFNNPHGRRNGGGQGSGCAVLKGGFIAVQGGREWSWGLVLRVLARARNS